MLLIAGWWSNRTVVQPVHPFPPFEQIGVSEITMAGNAKFVPFKTTLESWQVIQAALEPAYLDEHPAKWEVIGSVTLILQDGQSWIVALYSTGEGPCAFSIKKPGEEFGTYYRGGKTEALEKALRRVEVAAKPAGPSTQSHVRLKVISVVMLPKFKKFNIKVLWGAGTLDAWMITVKFLDACEDVGMKAGEEACFPVHSPSNTFSVEPKVGRTYDMKITGWTGGKFSIQRLENFIYR